MAPVVSKAQNAAMHAAAAGKSTLGIPKSVGEEFVEASHGKSLKKLPKKVGSNFDLKREKREKRG